MNLRTALLPLCIALGVLACGEVTLKVVPSDTTTQDTTVDTTADTTPAPDIVPPEETGPDVTQSVDLSPPEDLGSNPRAVDKELCNTYCDFATDTCLVAGAELGIDPQLMGFGAAIDCKTKCKFWAGLPAGTDGDTAKNNVHCRIYHTTAALGDPALHCPHAGLSGGNQCGSWCDVYCHLAQRNCTGSTTIYQDTASCLATCSSFNSDGIVGVQFGDSVQCRIEMALRAGSETPATQVEFCPDAAPDSGVCTNFQP